MFGFYLEISFALFVLMWNNRRRSYFWLRSLLVAAIGIPFYWLPGLRIGNIDVGYLVVVFSVFLLSYFLYRNKTMTLLTTSIMAFGLQHIAWHIAFLLFDAAPDILSNWPVIGVQALFLGIFSAIYGLVLFLVIRFHLVMHYSHRYTFSYLLSSIIIVVTIVLAQFVPLYGGGWNPIARVYTILVIVLSLIMEIAYPYIYELKNKEKDLEHEKETLENLIQMQAKQAQLSQETTDIINLRFHDMKNQLSTLRALNKEKQEEGIDELEKSIDIYSDIAKTGNEALDIVITQKSLLCSSEGIRFAYIINGSSLHFLSSTDITSLFGNIIDNAMEAVRQEEKRKKIIKLMVSSKENFLAIAEDNYCSKALTFKNGIPVSTKGDPSRHGYGLKSIRYIAEKYGGELQITLEDSIFHLYILIPIPEEKTASEQKAEKV